MLSADTYFSLLLATWCLFVCLSLSACLFLSYSCATLLTSLSHARTMLNVLLFVTGITFQTYLELAGFYSARHAEHSFFLVSAWLMLEKYRCAYPFLSKKGAIHVRVSERAMPSLLCAKIVSHRMCASSPHQNYFLPVFTIRPCIYSVYIFFFPYIQLTCPCMNRTSGCPNIYSMPHIIWAVALSSDGMWRVGGEWARKERMAERKKRAVRGGLCCCASTANNGTREDQQETTLHAQPNRR